MDKKNQVPHTPYDPEVADWWSTSIIDMVPGKIAFRGQPIQELMGNVSFIEMVWLMVMGEHIEPPERDLLEVAMVMSVDHGPQAPSIAIARMAATCGVGINNAMASAVNILGNNHGGAGEQCAELFYQARSFMQDGHTLEAAVTTTLQTYRQAHGKVIPGYGHRFHKPVDPRAPRTIEIANDYIRTRSASTIFVDIAQEIEKQIQSTARAPIPMNVDGASALIFCQLEVPPVLVRGLFCLARSVGILAHAWEQIEQNTKNKGPMPKKYLPTYIQKNNEQESHAK